MGFIVSTGTAQPGAFICLFWKMNAIGRPLAFVSKNNFPPSAAVMFRCTPTKRAWRMMPVTSSNAH